MRAATHVRCSTATEKKRGNVPMYLQNPEAQVQPLLEPLEHHGWELYRVYSGHMSDAKEARPGLGALLEDALRRRFGVVRVWGGVQSPKPFDYQIEPGCQTMAVSGNLHRRASRTSFSLSDSCVACIGGWARRLYARIRGTASTIVVQERSLKWNS